MADGVLFQRLRAKEESEKKITEEVNSTIVKPTEGEQASVKTLTDQIAEEFRDELIAKDINDAQLNAKIAKAIHERVDALNIPFERKKRIEKVAKDNIIGYGPIQPYIEDPAVTEIIIQRYDSIRIEKGGRIGKVTAAFTSEEHLRNVINRILQPINKQINLSTPIADGELKDGSRICAMIPPVAPDGATAAIRKFNNNKLTAERYLEYRSLTSEMMDFLEKCVKGRISIFISGGTGTGKTTFLNMLSGYIPEKELLITIEDTLELQLRHQNIRRFQTRAGGENLQPVGTRELVKAALRSRPDRIVVGEIRDRSIVDMLDAMSTGHEGSMSTGHANNPYNLVNVRMPMLFSQDADSNFSEESRALQISEAIQLIVQLGRLANGRRLVTHITAVDGLTEEKRVKLVDLFRYDEDRDMFYATGEIPERILELLKSKQILIDKSIFARKDVESE